MVQLDYRSNNPRWGLKGVVFKSWESFSFTLGYLSNPVHHKYNRSHSPNANISIHIESNNEQGAWDKEGRIHYYGSVSSLQDTFEDLYSCSSAGTRGITRRINSNRYILSLINDFGFCVHTKPPYTTAAVFPPDTAVVENHLRHHLMDLRLTNACINSCIDHFFAGYSL